MQCLFQYCKRKCVESCYCPEGTVINYNNTACIAKTQCGCYENGKRFDVGEVLNYRRLFIILVFSLFCSLEMEYY